MKKSITGAVALLAGAVIAHGQGLISFGDFYSSNPNGYTTVTFGGNPVGGSATHTGTPADTGVGSDWSVELYGVAGTTGVTAAQVEASPVQLDGAATGTFVTATLAGVPAGYLGQWSSTAVGDIGTGPGAATVAIAAWYNNGGTIASITAAQAAGFANGWSALGTVTTTTAPSLPAPLPNLGGTIATVGNVGSGSVPEPSSIALGVMGVGAFLARFRKK